MSRRNLERGRSWLLAAALAGAGLAAAIATASGGAATQATTTAATTTAATTTAATTTAATTTAATTTAATTTAPTTTAATTTAATTTAATTTAATTTAAATTTTATPPSNTAPPTVSGTPRAGSKLTASTGSWSGSTTATYTFQWVRCAATGGSCSAISGATGQTYLLGSADVGNTVRVQVTGHNAGGSATATSVPSAVVAGAVQPVAQAASNGCPTAPKGQTVDVSQVGVPARLQISGFQSNPARLGRYTGSFTLRVVVGDGCGHPVKGALVYVTAVPFEQFVIPPERPTGADGAATLTLPRASRFPASQRQELLALFLRARKPGEPLLGGISTRRLVSIPVSLR